MHGLHSTPYVKQQHPVSLTPASRQYQHTVPVQGYFVRANAPRAHHNFQQNASTTHSTFLSAARPKAKAADLVGADVEARLLEYLRKSLVSETALSEIVIHQLTSSAGNRQLNLNIKTTSKSPMPLLHLVVLNEVTPAPALENITAKLLQLGAAPEAQDEDGDSAVMALLSVAVDHEEDGESLPRCTLLAQLGALVPLLRSARLHIHENTLNEVCSWLRRFTAKEADARQHVLDALSARCGDEEVARVMCSEDLLAYLERCFDSKQPMEAKQVLDFLMKGASPQHSQGRVSAIHMIMLSPYSRYEELLPIFRSMLLKDPACVTVRDCFKMMPMQWATNYRDIASQHKLRQPNPANLLAFFPSVTETLPADVDAGEVCLEAFPEESRCDDTLCTQPASQLRFKEGDQIVCRVEKADGLCTWQEGKVVNLWYREACWPDDHPGAPYEVLLDSGTRVFALVDHDRLVRKPSEKPDELRAHGHLDDDSVRAHCYSDGHGHGHAHIHGDSDGHGHGHAHSHDHSDGHGHGHAHGHAQSVGAPALYSYASCDFNCHCAFQQGPLWCTKAA